MHVWSVVGEAGSGLRGRRMPSITGAARGVSRAGWVTAGLLALFLAFYVWIVASSIPISFRGDADGVYGQIADALLHGHTSLRDAPPGLGDLANPYDPKQNGLIAGQARLHDLSFYDGRIYAYWGPSPAIALFAPARLLGLHFSQSLATALFAWLGLLFSVLVLRTLARRFVPDAAAWKVNAGIVLLGLANVLPYTIRRPVQYEVAIAAGLCFAMLATWLLLSGVLRERPSLRRLALGSLALGTAVGARPSHVITAAGLLALCGWLLRRTPKGERRGPALALLAPVGACAVLLALFNYARFDSFTEFGLSYQLAGVDVTARDSFSLSYLLPGLWYYLVAPPRLLVIFPFVQLPPPPLYPGHVPKVYDGIEATGGILVLAPLILGLLAAPFLRGARRLEGELRAIMLAFVAIAAGLVVVAAIAFWGVTMRYEVDFASFLLLAALILWLHASTVSVRRRRLVTTLGVVAIAWASLLGLALSFTGSYGLLRGSHPGLWTALTRDFSLVSRLGAQVTSGGPVIADVQASLVDRSGRNLTSFDDQDVALWMGSTPTYLRIVMPSAGTIRLSGDVMGGPSVPPGSEAGLSITLPDGTAQAVPLGSEGGPFEATLRLPRGVQRVEMVPVVDGEPTGPTILYVKGLRVDGQ